jgi:hypothetical protein
MDVSGVLATTVVATGYLHGRLRPWRPLGDWAADQVRLTGAWVRGGTVRQAVVVLVHVLVGGATGVVAEPSGGDRRVAGRRPQPLAGLYARP